ncbi:hypothetical protein SJAV_01880 [Sulfurisphaera javensis]|uniref:Uncharacterized protein n=1 Tax=Sulfurisphaera javensis TaxID=2049879 RepID=A0AAT9GMX1_9CREN
MIRKVNRATSTALLFIIFISMRLLSMEKLMIIFLPFLLVSDSTLFLFTLALFPLAIFLLIVSAIVRFYQIVKSSMLSRSE